jgi:hypothetical protein
MIKFFRNIRQQLLMENKTGKPAYRIGRYLKYAIGEIVLVVVGILIALQINNWNNHRLNQQQEILLVSQLLEDTMADSLFINSRIQLFEAQKYTYSNLQALCNGTISDSVLGSFISGKNQTIPFISAASQSNVVNNNANTYSVISDLVLKKQLRDYQAKYEYFKVAIQIYNENVEPNLNSLSIKNYETFRKLQQDSLPFIELETLCADSDFKGIALISEDRVNNALTQTLTLSNYCNSLIKASKVFLNKNK